MKDDTWSMENLNNFHSCPLGTFQKAMLFYLKVENTLTNIVMATCFPLVFYKNLIKFSTLRFIHKTNVIRMKSVFVWTEINLGLS